MKFHLLPIVILLLISGARIQAQQQQTSSYPSSRVSRPDHLPHTRSQDAGPLLATHWDEGCLYNASCPADTGAHATCLHVPAGSGAVAMAQVMKYFGYPSHGTGEHGYQHPLYGIQYANFGQTNYDWTAMPVSLTTQNDAVATMLYQCGVAQDMLYGTTSSVSNRTNLDSAMVRYFGFNSGAEWKARTDFTSSGWFDLIRNEVDAARPVIISGTNSTGDKHRYFICDGYQAGNLFHINWGQGGTADGYYPYDSTFLDTVNYSFNQHALVGISPTISGAVTMDFESIPDFSLTFGNWTTRDIDQHATYGIENHVFPHQTGPMAFLCFNPAMVVPSMESDQSIQPHGGQRFGACFSSNPPANDDWFISPQVQLGINGSFSFWIKSYSSLYGLDKYTVAVSVSDNNPDSFTVISGSAPLETTINWTKKTFNLSGFNNQKVYIAIHCVSNDNFLMMIDDLEIKPSASAGITADFTADKTSARVGEAIAFSDQSTGGPTTWTWKFPGASPAGSSEQNPAGIKYSTPGKYPVTLKVSNGTIADSVTKQGFITITSYPASVTLDFEAYANFILAVPPWTLTDVKGGKTYGIEGVYFPNNYSPMAYICFNPSQTTPALTNMVPHGGQKLGCSFSSTPPNNPNDKWLISPKLSLGINPVMEFWVKSYNNNFGDEKFNVAVSVTDSLPGSFTAINLQTESAPMVWTRKVYDLSAYANQDVYVGIQCVTNDGFIFMIDDISITSTLGIGVVDGIEPLTISPNPARDRVTVRLARPAGLDGTLEVISPQGTLRHLERLSAGTERLTLDIHDMTPGIYFVRVLQDKHVMVGKLTVVK